MAIFHRIQQFAIDRLGHWFSSSSSSSSILPFSSQNEDVPENLPCHTVNIYPTVEQQCEFVRANGSCAYRGIFYSYTELTYCELGHLRPLALALLICILAMLFVAISTVADDFLCPSLLTISKTLRLPDNIAGVTLLAFGNGAPDIFSSISGIGQSKPYLVFSGLYGAGIFTTTVVTGTVLIAERFTIMKRPFLRDVSFYIGAVIVVWIFIFNGKLRISHSVSLVCYYLAYIVTVIISRYVYIRFRRNAKSNNDGDEEGVEAGGEEDEKYDATSIGISVIENELDAKSLRSIKSISRPNQHAITPDHAAPSSAASSRRNSCASYLSAGSSASTRKRVYSYEDGIVLTRFYRRGTLLSPRKRTNSGSHHHRNHHHHQHHHQQQQQQQNVHHQVDDQHRHRSISQAINSAINNHHNNKPPHKSGPEIGAIVRSEPKKRGYTNEIKFTNNFNRNRYFKPTFSSFSLRSFFAARLNNLLCQNSNAIGELRDLFRQLTPIDLLEWRHMSWFRKAYECAKAAPYLVMTVCIPVVDIGNEDCENWSRALTCVNVIVAPQMLLYLFSAQIKLNNIFPLWCLLLLVSIVIAACILVTSRRDVAPIYHRVFAFVGFGLSVIFVNTIAQEVVSVLTTFGVIFDLSDSILGLTILAWGNSIGDLISNNSLARQGYPGIAIAACFGGPMLNLLLGVGLPYTLSFISEDLGSHISIRYTRMATLLFVTLLTSLCATTIFFVAIKRFRSSRTHGAILLTIYAVYLIFALLLEFEIL